MSMASLGLTNAVPGHLSQASLIGTPSSTTDSLPLFQDSLDKIAESSIPRLQKIAGESMTVTCSLMSLAAETAGDVVTTLDPLSVNALLELPALSSRLLVAMEHDLLQLVIEIMCGGICSEPQPTAPRPRTSVDRQFARVFLNLIATTIEKECAIFGLGSAIVGQVDSKIDILALGKRTARVSIATFLVECLGRRASFRVAFPQPVVDRFKQAALPSSNADMATDPDWTERFKAEITRTVVSLDAFIEANTLTLGQIATLKVGQVLHLPKSAASRCELRSEKKLLFRCELGQAEGRYSLRIEEALPRDPDAEKPAKTDPSSFFNLS